MARQTKESKSLNCKIEKETFEMLEKFIQETKMSKTATVERALIEYIQKFKKTGKI